MKENDGLRMKQDMIEGCIHRALYQARIQHAEIINKLEEEISTLEETLKEKRKQLKNHDHELNLVLEILKEGYYMEGRDLKELMAKEKKDSLRGPDKKPRKKRVHEAKIIAYNYIMENINKTKYLSFKEIAEKRNAVRGGV